MERPGRTRAYFGPNLNRGARAAGPLPGGEASKPRCYDRARYAQAALEGGRKVRRAEDQS